VPPEPTVKRTYAFVDGQNLFYAAKKAFGYPYPNYEPKNLAASIAFPSGWTLVETFFYSGIPDATDNPFWNHFWSAKLAVMGTRGINTFSRSLRYRNQTIQLPDHSVTTIVVGQEKGVDIRIALDMVRLARESLYDVALVFSQDQDLSEAADEVRAISVEQSRWIKIACAFPSSPTAENRRGINGTEWIRIDRATYDQCLDPNDYRPKKK
jgi:NYN domain